MLEWAIALDMRNDNPCDRVLPVLGPQNDIVTHRLALPHKDVAAAIETVRTSKSGQPAVKLAFEFLVLTAARSAEIRLATWDEMDTAGRVWTVPALRMKAKREHRVPLCGRALEVLDVARALGAAVRSYSRCGAGGRSRPRRCPRCSSTTGSPPLLTASARRSGTGRPRRPHPREVIEAALAHVVQNKVEAAYARSDMFERRRKLMDDWAEYLASASG